LTRMLLTLFVYFYYITVTVMLGRFRVILDSNAGGGGTPPVSLEKNFLNSASYVNLHCRLKIYLPFGGRHDARLPQGVFYFTSLIKRLSPDRLAVPGTNCIII